MNQPDTANMLESYRQLAEISCDLASILDLDTLLGKILRVAVQIGAAQAASILLYDHRKQSLTFAAATNQESEGVLRGISVPMQSVAGWVALNRQPTVVDNVHQDERYYDRVEKATRLDTRSLLAVPMISRGRVIGVLEVLNKTDGNFNANDIEILGVLGTQAAVAIENSRLFQQFDLMSDLIHELRTPLTSISTIAYLLQQPNLAAEQRLSMAHTIQDETRRLNEMAGNYLDLSRLESGRASFEWSVFSPLDLLEEAVQIMIPRAAENHIIIQLQNTDPLPQLEADRDRLKQVLLNLLSNAIKYNKPGGSVFLHAWREGEQLLISVRDTGIGIPNDLLPELFERFFRHPAAEKASKGTGLGLSISRKIIENHQGQLDVTSQVDVGTTFIVRLPFKQNRST